MMTSGTTLYKVAYKTMGTSYQFRSVKVPINLVEVELAHTKQLRSIRIKSSKQG
jgi:hypothetical protein